MDQVRTYLVMKVAVIVPVVIDGVPEEPPPELLDREGRPTPLAMWPNEGPWRFTAVDEETALAQARHQWAAEGAGLHRNDRLTEAQYQQLRHRPDPAHPGHAAVIEKWVVQEVGTGTWHAHDLQQMKL